MQLGRNSTLLLPQALRAKEGDFGVLDMPSFCPARLTSQESRELSWGEFKGRLDIFGGLSFSDISPQLVLSSKNVSWGSEDLNIFVGQNNREINEIDDLDDREGERYLEVNFNLARQLAKDGRGEVQVNIGFNPQEFTVGHHSIARVHSHVRAIGHPSEVKRRQPVKWRELDWFDRLSFIEPFCTIHQDMLSDLVGRGIFRGYLSQGATSHLGFTSLYFNQADGLPGIFSDLKTMYSSMKAEYNRIEPLFTEKIEDSESGRYLPRLKKDRIELLEEFLDSEGSKYSEESQNALRYLATNLRNATLRHGPRVISEAANAYITRGFSGALTFTFNFDSPEVRFDFLPRVITTSGINKVVSGLNKGTIIAKGRSEATQSERETMTAYHRKVCTILERMYPENFRRNGIDSNE